MIWSNILPKLIWCGESGGRVAGPLKAARLLRYLSQAQAAKENRWDACSCPSCSLFPFCSRETNNFPSGHDDGDDDGDNGGGGGTYGLGLPNVNVMANVWGHKAMYSWIQFHKLYYLHGTWKC